MKRAVLLLPLFLVTLINARPARAQSPQPPAQFLSTPYPTQTGLTISVPVGGNLQTFINSAVPGDTIVLPPGGGTATFTGNFVLPAKPNPNNRWIVIRPASAALDAGGALSEGTRVNPANPAHSAALAVVRTSNSTSVFTAESGASYYRLVGLDIGTTVSLISNLVQLGDGSQTSDSLLPHDITIDRSYIHGNDSGNFKRGVGLNGNRLAVIDSYLSNFHHSSPDAHPIGGWNGRGPFKIVNNFLEGADQSILFGGADPASVNLIPSDIEVRRNTMTKRLSWRGVLPVKTVFELKNAARVLVDGNIIEYAWKSGQDGYAVMITPKNSQGNCTWCAVEDVTFTNNIVRHAAGGINLLGRHVSAGGNSDYASRLLFRNNLFYDIYWGSCTPPPYTTDCGWGVNSAPQGRLILFAAGPRDVAFDHNTFIQRDDAAVYFSAYSASTGFDTISNFVFTNNLLRKNSVAFHGEGVQDDGSPLGTKILNSYAPGWIFDHNVFANAPSSDYPANNTYDSGTVFETQFRSYSNGNGTPDDYRLDDTTTDGDPASHYIGAASDGSDLGVDFDELTCALSGCGGGTGSASEIAVLTDNFNDNVLNTGIWTKDNLFSGNTDTAVTVAETNGRIEIGPLSATLTGTHYNGIRTGTLNFTNSTASVEVPSGSRSGRRPGVHDVRRRRECRQLLPDLLFSRANLR